MSALKVSPQLIAVVTQYVEQHPGQTREEIVAALDAYEPRHVQVALLRAEDAGTVSSTVERLPVSKRPGRDRTYRYFPDEPWSPKPWVHPYKRLNTRTP